MFETSQYNRVFKFLAERVVALNPLLRECVSLSLHAPICVHQLFWDRYLQLVKKLEHDPLVIRCQVFVVNSVWLNDCHIKIALPGPFVFLNLLDQMLDRFKTNSYSHSPHEKNTCSSRMRNPTCEYMMKFNDQV